MGSFHKAGRIRFILTVLAAVMLMPLLSSCKKPDEENEKIIFGVCQANLTDSWQSSLKADIESEIDKLGNAAVVFEDAGNSSQKQRIDIERMIKRDVDIIIVAPCPDCDIAANLSSARKAGIPVIVLGDTPIDKSFYDMCIFADNHKLGVMAGQTAAEMLNGHGKILEIQDEMELRSTQNYKTGFLEGISDAPGIEKEYVVQGYGTAEGAENALRGSEILELDTDIDLIFAHNSIMAAGVREVLEEKGMYPAILSINQMSGSAYDITEEQKNGIDCYLSCVTGGREAVAFGRKLIDRETVPEVYELEIEVVSR